MSKYSEAAYIISEYADRIEEDIEFNDMESLKSDADELYSLAIDASDEQNDFSDSIVQFLKNVENVNIIQRNLGDNESVTKVNKFIEKLKELYKEDLELYDEEHQEEKGDK